MTSSGASHPKAEQVANYCCYCCAKAVVIAFATSSAMMIANAAIESVASCCHC